MAVTISQHETQALALLRDFLLAILPFGAEVVRGQNNRTPEPVSDNFVVMTPLLRKQLETTVTEYEDNGAGTTRTDVQPTELTVQLDFHGPSSGDYVQIFTTLWRSDYGVENFNNDTTIPGAPVDVTPLYFDDPRQAPFINGEGQYEERWIVNAAMQVNPRLTTVIQSATEVSVGIIQVDATYPP